MQQLEPQQFATWAEPIDMLYACHGRVKAFCRQLAILPNYLAKNGLNQAVKNDVQQILNYFTIAAPLHHDDEELDFFPALAKKHAEAQLVIDELASQHETLHATWAEMKSQLQALLNGERENVDPELIARFIQGYEVHIALEEPLFELGREYLAQVQLSEMGKIMADRRKVK